MGAPARARWAILALAVAVLAPASSPARAGAPPSPGGTVPSLLKLSLSEPSPFKPTGKSSRGNLYTATIRAEVTATDAPVTLSLADGETLKRWRQPVTRAKAKIRLRRLAPSARALKSHHELLWVTLTAAGP